MRRLLFLPLAAILFSCGPTEEAPQPPKIPAVEEVREVYAFTVEEFSDDDYPDNPDIGFRASNYRWDYFSSGKVYRHDTDDFTLTFFAAETTGDTISFPHLPLQTWMPAIPVAVKNNDYLRKQALINQEWNRNQVSFNASAFESTNPEIIRADIARNCLRLGLWEVILFVREGGKEVPKHHGWFEFPETLYAELFAQVNGTDFGPYQAWLSLWKDVEAETLWLSELRQVDRRLVTQTVDRSDAMYPLEGARKKKRKEIVTPEAFAAMRDLQSDKTTFATFVPPGLYSRDTPRATQLGRFKLFDHAEVNQVYINGEQFHEMVLHFTDIQGTRKTRFVLGGIDLHALPHLTKEEANAGWKSSMGIGNHPFYEDQVAHEKHNARTSPYYCFLMDAEDRWLDSHAVGIDGPLLHWDAAEPNTLHLWLLSFERHALVGHYVTTFDENL